MPGGDAPMRDWGHVEAGELDRVVVISPHLDDAVLGCGALLATRPEATVITVFAGRPRTYPDPPTGWDALAGFAAGDDVLAARREEDAAALARLGATPVWLDHVEHQYLDRTDRGTRRDARDARAAAVVDDLEAAIGRWPRPSSTGASLRPRPGGSGSPPTSPPGDVTAGTSRRRILHTRCRKKT